MSKKRLFGEFVGDIETRVPKPAVKQVGAIVPGQTAFAMGGLSAFGTPLGTITDFNDVDGRALNCATAGGAGNQAGYVSALLPANGEVETRWNPYMAGKFKIVAPVVAFRFWAGLFSGNPTAIDQPAVGFLDALAIRCSTTAANPNFVAVTGNGALATENIVDFPIPVVPVVNAIHTFSIEVKNAGQGATITLDTQSMSFLTNLPALGAGTGLGIYFGITAIPAAIYNMRFYYCYLETDR